MAVVLGVAVTSALPDGRHKFYAWEDSRREFAAAIAKFVADAVVAP